MANRSVELTVAGTSCRVVSTASEDELRELAAMVEEKLGALVKPGRPLTAQSALLAAVALAHEVQEQKSRADRIAAHATQALGDLLERVDTALAKSERGAGGAKASSAKASSARAAGARAAGARAAGARAASARAASADAGPAARRSTTPVGRQATDQAPPVSRGGKGAEADDRKSPSTGDGKSKRTER